MTKYVSVGNLMKRNHALTIWKLNVIQSNYLQHRISFELHGIDQTIHDQWATGNDPLSMKRYLRRGSYQDLNVYFLTDWRSKMGLSSLPKKAPNSTELILDGCDIDASSMPGGWQSDAFNHGMTAVHEIGHWFGLLHVFQPSGPGVDPDGPGTCDGPGDYVADTPTQRDPTKGCPKRQDSCPKLPGLDDSHNIMDYSDDKWYERRKPFSPLNQLLSSFPQLTFFRGLSFFNSLPFHFSFHP